MLEAVAEIRRALGDDAVSTDHEDLEEHGHSDWSTSNTDVRPVAVVRPGSTEHVSAIGRICSRYRVPMIPYGAGSSVEGNFSSPFSGVCIDLSAMDRIVAFHPDDMDIVVQPGVNWTRLNEDVKDSGLFLPLDPSPTALIGGMVATNCSGTNATKYGTMKDYVVNLTVVLADGTVIKTRNRPRKTSAGYNLNGLFAGSEGTLGIITEITLKLAIVPASFSVATSTFATVREAADAAAAMIRKGVPVAALELMDEAQMHVVNKNGGAGGRLWDELPTLFIKFSGTKNTIKDSLVQAREVAESRRCKSFESADTAEQMDSLWSARKQALWASLAIRPEGTQIWSTDVAVPLSRIGDIIESSRENASKLGLFNSILGHVGDGNFHQMIMYNPGNAEQTRAVGNCVNSMVDKALELEGTVSGEHGIGLGKKVCNRCLPGYDMQANLYVQHCLAKELDPATIGVMKALKEALDPQYEIPVVYIVMEADKMHSDELDNAPHRRSQLSHRPARVYDSPPHTLATQHRQSTEPLTPLRRRKSVILDATDEAYLRIGKRKSQTFKPDTLSDKSSELQPAAKMFSTSDQMRNAADYNQTRESLYDSFRWLEEEDDLDLRLYLDDYHMNLREEVPVPTKNWRPSFRRHLSISKRPFGRASISLSRPATKDSNVGPMFMASPVGSAPGSPGHVRRRSRALSLMSPNKQMGRPDSPLVIDPSASHYQDPDARMKLRVYLASPHKFDEAIEFGFPSIDEVQDKENSAHSRAHSRTDANNKLRTFLEDDASSIYSEASAAEPESPRTPDTLDKHLGVRPAQVGQDRGAEAKLDYAQAPASSREMTLRMTLTRSDLRAGDEQIYGWQKHHAARRSQPRNDLPSPVPFSRDGNSKESIERQFAAMDQEDLSGDSGMVKRFWNRMRRT
ncbi:Cell cycle checkpoint protein RAD17 [Purpureocillium lavendulum]|uniref:Cell cycle checkpoint protein RAD17 n=1 Tax=Purpureocillium lavendulum TaxID=1247861 RepID=A0AB34G387_9HYPO|nr:Cell cycle checkpoint protein RAD17 [Purpureocillium lavendulum]